MSDSQDAQFIFDTISNNDEIDIEARVKPTVNILKSDIPQEIIIEIEGKCIDNSIVNAIRRVILDDIPIYGFNRSNIFIDVKKSRHMYDNDKIYCQIEALPIFDVPNYFDLENPEIYLPNEIMKKIFGEFIQEKNTDQEHQNQILDSSKHLFRIEMSISVKNNTGNYKYVSTHDALLKIDGKQSDSYLNYDPIDLLVLKPNEEIYFRAEANLGIAKMNAAYEATSNAIFKELSSSKFQLIYETLGQIPSIDIFKKACIILSKKMAALKEFIENKFPDERKISELINIQLYGEDHTLGNLLATALQKCVYVEKAAYAKTHPYVNVINVEYELFKNSEKGPIEVIIGIINYLKNIFDEIMSQV